MNESLNTTESLCYIPEMKSIILQLKKKSYYVPGPKLNPVNNHLIESSQATIWGIDDHYPLSWMKKMKFGERM